MSDTQWPRFEVFVQEQPGRPHQHAGSVHAPDPEMALLNARDVFVRRPECTSLWIAPAAAVRGGTAEELEGIRNTSVELRRSRSAERSEAEVEGPEPVARFVVFAKLEQRGTLMHTGEVAAEGSEAALAAAFDAAPRPPLVLWVIPAESVERSLPEEAASLFDPSRDKPYRDQAFYHIQTALRDLRRGRSSMANRRSPQGPR